jgi:hypothetical protein
MSMVTDEQARLVNALQALLDRVTYKPGYKFRALVNREPDTFLRPNVPMVEVRYTAQDARSDYPQETEVVATVPFPLVEQLDLFTDVALFAYFRHSVLGHLEQHETDEWFRVDGELVNDPHAPGWRP